MRHKYKHNDDGTTTFLIESAKYGTREVLIDTEDFDKVSHFKWNIRHRPTKFSDRFDIKTTKMIRHPDGGKRPCGRTRYKAITTDLYKFILEDVEIPDGSVIKRANNNFLDCRKSNLVVCDSKSTLHRRANNKINSKGDICEIVFENTEYGKRVAIIDAEDWEKIKHIKWRIRWNDNYLSGWISGEKRDVRLHRFLLDAPDHLDVDHINRNPLDNRRENIRLATRTQNMANRGPNSTNPVGLKGVKITKSGFFSARISWRKEDGSPTATVDPKYYTTPEEAARSYNRMALERWGAFAGLNDVDNYVRTQAVIEAIERQ